jgi:putative integral membrane protein (TIGR02587 family)
MSTKTIKTDSILGGYGRLFIDLGRANAGALLFSFPLLMTMEVWWLGFSMNGYRMALFIFLSIPLMIGMSYFDGFEDTQTIAEDVREAFIAYLIGFMIAGAILFMFGVLESGMSTDEIVGKISLQAVVAGLGAMFTQSLLGPNRAGQNAEKHKRSLHFSGQLFLTAVGALFLSISVAPTEEVVLISYKMDNWQTIGLAGVSLGIMHGFIYAAHRKRLLHGVTGRSAAGILFLRMTVPGYAVALLISFYILWTFGALDGLGMEQKLKAVIVLGFPAAIGGGASRLIV